MAQSGKANQKAKDKFQLLKSYMSQGFTELVSDLLYESFTEDEIKTFKVDGKVWPLHLLRNSAFVGRNRIHATETLIEQYVVAGWDVNSVSDCTEDVPDFYPKMLDGVKAHKWSNFTLLHIACLYGCTKIIRLLVKMRANLNVVTTSEEDPGAKIAPLHILILKKDYPNAHYLITSGANPFLKGTLYKRDWDIWHHAGKIKMDAYESYTPIGLTLYYCNRQSKEFANYLINKFRSKLGKEELNMARLSSDTDNILDILSNMRLHGKNQVSLNDISWVEEQCIQSPGKSIYAPLFTCLLVNFRRDWHEMSRLIDELDNWKYDFNICGKDNDDDNDDVNLSMLYFVLRSGSSYEVEFKILKKLIKMGKLNLVVQNSHGVGPIEYALKRWLKWFTYNGPCSSDCNCSLWQENLLAIIKLLMKNGAEVTNLTVNDTWDYHIGFDEFIKIIFLAGAKVDLKYFSRHAGTDEVGEDTKCDAGNDDKKSKTKRKKRNKTKFHKKDLDIDWSNLTIVYEGDGNSEVEDKEMEEEARKQCCEKTIKFEESNPEYISSAEEREELAKLQNWVLSNGEQTTGSEFVYVARN